MPTSYLDPTGEVINIVDNWTPSTGVIRYLMIDDGTRQPTVPNTTDYIYGNPDDSINTNDEFTFPDFDIEDNTCTQITIWIYGFGISDTFVATGNIYVNGSYLSAQPFNGLWMVGSETWDFVTFSGSWNQSDINNLKVKLTTPQTFAGSAQIIYAMYVEIQYEEIVGSEDKKTGFFFFS